MAGAVTVLLRSPGTRITFTCHHGYRYKQRQAAVIGQNKRPALTRPSQPGRTRRRPRVFTSLQAITRREGAAGPGRLVLRHMGAGFHLAHPQLADPLLSGLQVIKYGGKLSLPPTDSRAVFTESNNK
eukprot:superscaffoldBa00002923_g15647